MAYPYNYGMYPPQNQYQSQIGQNYIDRLNLMQKIQVPYVNGKKGADFYPMPADSSILLLDESQPIVWLKKTDGAGYPTCTPYKITPIQEQAEPGYNSLNDRITRLEAILNGKSDNATTEQNDSTSGQ